VFVDITGEELLHRGDGGMVDLGGRREQGRGEGAAAREGARRGGGGCEHNEIVSWGFH